MVVGIVLAAGRSSRTATPKQLRLIDGEPMVVRACRTLREGGCDRVIVVIAEPHADAIAKVLRDVGVARNEDPERGMSSSLHVGIGAAGDAEAIVFSLVDHPHVRSSTVATLIARYRAGDGDALRATFAAKPGHPALLSKAAMKLVQSDASARDAIQRWTDIAVDDPAVGEDLDTDADVLRP